MTKINKIQAEANRLNRAGRSTIPLDANKKPTVKWKKYQRRIPGRDELEYDEYIGMVCGEVSGNVEAIDIDKKNSKDRTLLKQIKTLVEKQLPGLWEKLTVQRTISGGWHLVKGPQMFRLGLRASPLYAFCLHIAARTLYALSEKVSP